MQTQTDSRAQTTPPLTTRQKAGHVIGFALGLDMITTLVSQGTGDDATPVPVLALIVVIMLLILGLLASSWAGNRRLPRRIAAELFLARKTVSNQLTLVFAKLGVADRAEAVVKARQSGLGG